MRRREFITLAGAVVTTLPRLAWGQQTGKMRRVGLLLGYLENDVEARTRIDAFVGALEKLGWKDGQTIRLDYRWGNVRAERARTQATELIALAPDVIFAQAAPAISAVRERTKTIPIVFTQSGDPVEAGSVESLARPGRNLTGFLTSEPTISAKLLQLLKDVAPKVTHVTVLQFENSAWRNDFAAIKAVAAKFSVHPKSAILRNESEIEPAIAAAAREPNGGLLLPGDTRSAGNRKTIVTLAAKHRLPAIYASRNYAEAGGLLSYSVDQLDTHRLAAGYVDRILRGTRPDELPVQAPSKFELVINLKTAKALGLDISPTMLIGADEVIE